jgi:hypothetical protein
LIELDLSFPSQTLSRANGPRPLPLICAHQLSPSQDVAFHRKNYILSMGSGLKLEFGVERIEPKEIPVRAVLGRRAGASVADALEIIPTLYCAIGEAPFRRRPFR